MLVGIPAISNEVIVLSEELQLTAVFILFCSTMYTQAGGMLSKGLDDYSKEIEDKFKAVDDNMLVSLKSAQTANKQLADLEGDVKSMFELKDSLASVKAETLNKEEQLKFREEIVRKLDALVALEDTAVNALRARMVDKVKADVVATFQKDTKAKEAALLAHGLGGEVGVGPGAVPVALHGLGLEGGHDPHVLAQAVQQPAGDHHLVAHLQGAHGADLVLPLPRHDLRVDPRDPEPGLDAGVEVGLREGTAVGRLGAHAAVVVALGGGVAHLGPAEDAPVLAHHGVLLLEAVEGLVRDDAGVGLEEVGQGAAGVGGVRGAVGLQHLAHDQHVVPAADGVGVGRHGLQQAVRVLAHGLLGGGAVEGPHRVLGGVRAGGDGLLQDLGLGAHLVEHGALLADGLLPVEPDVLALLREPARRERAARREARGRDQAPAASHLALRRPRARRHLSRLSLPRPFFSPP